MKTARGINHVVGSFETRLWAEIVARWKTLQGAGSIAVMLLCSLVGWTQNPPTYLDSIVGSVTCPDGTKTSFKATGSAANDYNLDETTGTLSCGAAYGNGSANAAAHVGSLLAVYAHDTTAEGTAHVSPLESAGAGSRDTVQLTPPTGFTGQSIKIGINLAYGLSIKGTAFGGTEVCWQWTGRSMKCDSLYSSGSRNIVYSSQIVVKKTTKGFQFYVDLNSAVSVGGTGSATAVTGTPTFSLPTGWTYIWASGE